MKFITLFVPVRFQVLAITPFQGQPEVAPWSNIRGILLDSELMGLNSTLGFVGKDWSAIRKTAKERAGSGNLHGAPGQQWSYPAGVPGWVTTRYSVDPNAGNQSKKGVTHPGG